MTKIYQHSSNPNDGTSFYRSYGPLKRLPNVQTITAKKGIYEWSDIIDMDICFFQRPASQFETLNITICKSFNKPVWIDYDDYSIEISNPDNPATPYYERDAIKATTIEAIRLADVVTVSTPALKDALLEHVPTANIHVVTNAIDDKMFSFEPYKGPRTKSILMRGGSSHLHDWKSYHQAIKATLEAYPEYTIHIMGYHPEFVSEYPKAKYYKFSSIPEYFQTLMEIRPEIMIVPLEDDKFNRAKSAIALYEGVMAGAAVTSTKLPEFEKHRTLWFRNNEDLIFNVEKLIASESMREALYLNQLATVPKLSDVNELRLDIIESLTKNPQKYSPTQITKEPASDKEFFDYSLAHGHNQEDPVYKEAHEKSMEWLVKKTNCKTALELGVGTGGSLVPLLQQGVYAFGIEYNPYSVQYFKEHYPLYTNQVIQGDITTEPIEVDEPGDLVMSIEVFEHLDKDDEWFVTFLSDLAYKFKWFYFSSTPYSDRASFDDWWGHVGVRRTKKWIEIFEKSGWKFAENPRKLTSWDCLFKSEKV